MPITIQPATLKYRNGQGTFQNADCLKGDPGATPELSIGTVSTLQPGQSATVNITGTPEHPVMNFGIPKGQKGDPGDTPDVSGKADKVSEATNDNFAALDTNGNLKDSGHKHSDYASVSKVQAVEDSIAPDYADLVFPVEAGQRCYHENVLYSATQDIATAETWMSAHWELVTVNSELNSLKNALTQKISKPNNPSTGDFLTYNGTAWVAETVPSASGVSF